MKKIFLVILVMWGFVISLCQSSYHIEAYGTKKFSPMLSFIPDSIQALLANDTFIVYSYGHHCTHWALINRSENTFRIYIGTSSVNNGITNVDYELNKLPDYYKGLINWGIDSMPVMAKDMTPRSRGVYTTFYNSLDVFNSYNIVFSSEDFVNFSGPDSIYFNKKVNDLCYLMYWLSAPELRQYLPSPNNNENSTL